MAEAMPPVFPDLETERLRLRQPRPEDYEAYCVSAADAEVRRYLNGEPLDREQAWRELAYLIGHWGMRGFGFYTVEERATGRWVGRIGFNQPEGWPGFELGWTLARDAWGQGYATEAARACLEHAWSRGIPRVISVIAPENRASIAVAERIGETYERDTRVLGWDVRVYGIDRPQ